MKYQKIGPINNAWTFKGFSSYQLSPNSPTKDNAKIVQQKLTTLMNQQNAECNENQEL